MYSTWSVLVKICVFILAHAGSYGVLGVPIRCPLVWDSYTLGLDVPSDAIPAIDRDLNNFIARGIDVSLYRIGRLDTKGGAFIADDANVASVTPADLQILRNSNGCKLEWVTRSNKPADEFLTWSGGLTQRFVGKATVNGEYFSGEVDGSRGVIVISDQNGKLVETGDFLYLRSYSNGLRLEFTDLQFTGDPFQGTIDFMGIDTISNGAEVEISQTLNHRKSVTTSMSVSHEHEWAYSTEISFSIGIDYSFEFGNWFFNALGLNLGFEFGVDASWESGGSSGSVYGREDTIEVSSTRVITVPPFIRVQACTVLGMIEKFSRSYVARGKYTAPGWTGQEIYNHLVKQSPSPEGMEVFPTYVTSTERGTFGGNLFLSNVMIVVEKSEEGGGCDEMQRLIAKLKDVRSKGRRLKIDTTKEEAELEERIRRIASPLPRNRTASHPAVSI